VGKKKKRSGPRPLRDPGLPEGVNLYDHLKQKLREGETGSFQGTDIEDLMEKVDRTLDHFQVGNEGRSNAGNLLIRFAIMMSAQEEGRRFTSDDPILTPLLDMYEYLNNLGD
jgi:hypothetical protein